MALVGAPSALADDWLPHPADATWTYEWSDSVYNTTPTKEKVTVKEQNGNAFTLDWTTHGPGQRRRGAVGVGTDRVPGHDLRARQHRLVEHPPPPVFPILCPQVASAATASRAPYYTLIWGARAPMLAAPLLEGRTGRARGGADGDVTSSSQYLGREQITVPAFPEPVVAAKVRTDSRRPERSAIHTAAAFARSGGCTASGP